MSYNIIKLAVNNGKGFRGYTRIYRILDFEWKYPPLWDSVGQKAR